MQGNATVWPALQQVSVVLIDPPAVSLQAERIMEALELYKEETMTMEEHKFACANAGKEVETSSNDATVNFCPNVLFQ